MSTRLIKKLREYKTKKKELKKSIEPYIYKLVVFLRALFYYMGGTLCHGCPQFLKKGEQLFCIPCLSKLGFYCPIGRCPICFSSNYCTKTKRCGNYKEHRPYLQGMAHTLEYEASGKVFIRELKYGRQHQISDGAASLMAKQLCELDWPLPDYVIPVPLSFPRMLVRGQFPSDLLAYGLSKIIPNLELKTCLMRKSFSVPQTSLGLEERMKMDASEFYFRPWYSIEDKIVLLVDDVSTTGQTFRACAMKLYEYNPKAIYALSFCATPKRSASESRTIEDELEELPLPFEPSFL